MIKNHNGRKLWPYNSKYVGRWKKVHTVKNKLNNNEYRRRVDSNHNCNIMMNVRVSANAIQ